MSRIGALQLRDAVLDGTRMQQGTVAFLQMVKIAAAVELHKPAHLPYLVCLRHPTTGGVFASWGSLGHVTATEPSPASGRCPQPDVPAWDSVEASRRPDRPGGLRAVPDGERLQARLTRYRRIGL